MATKHLDRTCVAIEVGLAKVALSGPMGSVWVAALTVLAEVLNFNAFCISVDLSEPILSHILILSIPSRNRLASLG